MYTYLACIGNYQLEQLRNNYVEVTENGKVDVNVRHYLDLDARKPVFWGLRINTGADQPAHSRRLISAFVIRLSRSVISRLATSEILIF